MLYFWYNFFFKSGVDEVSGASVSGGGSYDSGVVGDSECEPGDVSSVACTCHNMDQQLPDDVNVIF